ncbi:MAG: amidohydrolase family protein, partial [Candidatus Nanopelagicus sp.]
MIKISRAKLTDGRVVDIEIENKVITQLQTSTGKPIADSIDAGSKLLLPGLVDLHTHLREPGREDSETILTGSKAAVAGGFTAVSAMANTNPVADNAGVVEQIYRLGKEAGLIDVQPIGAVTQGLNGEKLSEMGAMADSIAKVRIFSDD